MNLIPLDRDTPAAHCGGKAAGLYALQRLGARVPFTAVLSADDVDALLDRAGVKRPYFDDEEDVERSIERGRHIQQRIFDMAVPEQLLAQAQGLLARMPALIVRSSASGEDGNTLSLAGHFESCAFASVDGFVFALKLCLCSYFESHCVVAMHHAGLLHTFRAGLVIQELVAAHAAGVSFTATDASGQVSVYSEACFGLGESLVDGKAVAQRILNDTFESFDVSEVVISCDASALVPCDILRVSLLGNELEGSLYAVEPERRLAYLTCVRGLKGKVPLSPEHIAELQAEVRRIRAQLPYEVDVEWALDERGALWLVQLRPVTTETKSFFDLSRAGEEVAFPGRQVGVVRVVNSEADLHRVQDGDILVAANVDASYMSALTKAGAVVMEQGSYLCHAATICRELGIPTVTGMAGATKNFIDGTLATLDTGASIRLQHCEGSSRESKQRRAPALLVFAEKPSGTVEVTASGLRFFRRQETLGW